MLLVSIVFTLALLAFGLLVLLSAGGADGAAGEAVRGSSALFAGTAGTGVDGLRWREDKSLGRGDSRDCPLRSRLGVIGEALTSRERKLGAIVGSDAGGRNTASHTSHDLGKRRDGRNHASVLSVDTYGILTILPALKII